MIEIGPDLKSDLKKLFDQFDNQGVKYVILRGYEDLFENIPGNDLDVLIHPGDFDMAKEVCNSIGFRVKKFWIRQVAEFSKLKLYPPSKGFSRILSSPKKNSAHIYQALKGGSIRKYDPPYCELKRFNQGLMLHGYDRLVYKSPKNRIKIPVVGLLTQHMLDYREKNGGFWVPSAVDEVLHLVCRCVFDHRGDPPEYYLDMLNDKTQELINSQCSVERFLKLAGEVFGKQTYKICSHVLRGDLEQFLELAEIIFSNWISSDLYPHYLKHA